MGVNTKIYLPQDVRIRDVANVVGILAGLKPYYQYDGIIDIEGLSIQNDKHTPGLSNITLVPTEQEPLIDNESWHQCLYFMEISSNHRLLYCGCNPFWREIGKALVDFYGGHVDFNDCDDIEVDYKKPHKPFRYNCEDDQGYNRERKRIEQLKSLPKIQS